MPVSIENTVIRFNDGTTQSTAAGAGGVTSLNGQTGAITNTNVDSIGSYVIAFYGVNTPSAPNGATNVALTSVGNTVAGSNLRYNYSQIFGSWQGMSTLWYRNNSTAWGGGGSSLSGTWRAMSYENRTASESDGAFDYRWTPALWVRIS